MDIKIQSLLDTISTKLETDILFECFAGLVADTKSYSANNIHVLPVQNFRRNYDNDISTVKELRIEDEKNDYKEERVLEIHTSRNSILDYLPEAFFEQKPFKLKNETKEQWQQRLDNYWKLLPKKIESAKIFFQPLEIEYNKIRVYRERGEVELLKNKNPLLEKIWQQFPIKTPAQRRFVSTLHLLTYVIGDGKKTKHLIQYVLGKKITLEFGVRQKTTLPDTLKPALGQCALGFSTNIGNEIYEYARTCKLTIMDLGKREFFDYQDKTSIPGIILTTIEKYYFPLDIEVEKDFKISTAPQRIKSADGSKEYEVPIDQFFLNADTKVGDGCLGISTRLGEPIEVLN